MTDDKNAKERILDASISLFADHGFDGVGIRKIAQQADVNVSMINYYFKTKEGILLELSEIFFNMFDKNIRESELSKLNLEERFEKLFTILTNILRKHHELFKVIIYTNSTSKIKFNEIKAERLKKIIMMIYGQEVMQKHLQNKNSQLHLSMIGPGAMGLAFSHFMIRDVISNVTHDEFDDKFYEEYPKVMSKLFLHGVKDDLEKLL